MSRRRRIAWLAATALSVVLVAAVAAVAWLLDTEAGARWGFTQLGAIVHGELDVHQVTGRLRGPLRVHQLTFRTPIAEVTIDTLDVDWRLRTLWRRRLEVKSLYAANVRWVVGQPGEHPGARDSLARLPAIRLPVAILIHRGELHHVQITPSERDTGILIDRVDMSASDLTDGLHVDRLVVHSRPVELSIDGKLVPRGSYPLSLTGRWEYRPAGGPRLAGAGTVTGSLDTLRVIQDLSSPFAGHLDAFFYRPRTRMHFRARLQVARIEPRTLQPGWPAGDFRGWVFAEGDPGRFAARGSLAGASAATGPARADFDLSRDGATWRLDRLTTILPAARTVLHGRGAVRFDSSATRFQLASDWTGLDWPLQGTPLVRSQHGAARLDGTPADFAVHVDAALAGPRMPPGHWRLDGRGGNGRLAIRTFVANLLEGRLDGSGEVAWTPRPRWRLRVTGRHLDPGAAWPAWPGAIAFAGSSQGAMSPRGPEGRVLITRMAGTLRGQPISGSGTITARDRQYTLAGAGLHWGPDHFTASGGFGRRWSLQWNLTAPALAAVLPNASGSLTGQGSVRGPAPLPHVIATLRGDSLFFGRLHAGTLRVDGDLDLAPRGVMRLDAAATQVDAGRHGARRLRITARGTRERHELRASVTGQVDSLVTVLAGGFGADHVWRGALSGLDLVNRTAGHWTLQSPAPLVLAPGEMRLTGVNWGSGAQRVTLTADWRRPGPWQLDSELQQVQLAMLGVLLPETMRLTGPVAGRIRAHGTAAGQVWCDAALAPGPGEIAYRNAAGKWVPTRFDHARIELRADGRRLAGRVQGDLDQVGTLRAELALAGYGEALPPEREPLSGRLTVHLRDLALAQGFTGELVATGGRLDTDLRFGGTVAHPTLRGPFEIRDGIASLPRLGIDLREVQLKATSSAGGRLALDGSLRSGPGVLKLHGSAALGDRARPMATLAASGERLQAMHTREMSFVVSPDLKLALSGRRVDVSGQVAIPEGTIEVEKNEKATVIRPSADVVYRGSDTQPDAPFEVHSQVRIVLGDKVTFRGFGLDMRPTGSVLVNEDPGLPPLGTGQLEVKDGRYKIYGQELGIDQARLVFGGGPLMNPGIHARASRKSGGVTAGFDVGGTVQKPDVHLFSDPAMGESQALSYIMFGKPLERGNLSQGQLLSTMATNLGVRGSNLIAHGSASAAGVEQAKVEAGDAFRNASLSLGTHLSPKLYLSYGVGLFENVAALRLRYLVSSAWSVEAESARQNRVDVLYTVEK